MPLARPLALCAGLALLLVGLITQPMPWSDLAPRVFDTGFLLAVAALAGAVVSRLLGLPLAGAIVLVGLGAPALVYAGLPAILAALLVALGGLALGSLMPNGAARWPLVRWVAGMGLLAAVGGWLLPFPIHFAPTWGIALALLVGWRFAEIRSDLSCLREDLGSDIRRNPIVASLAALALVAVASPSWLPNTQQDDMTYHLGLAWQLRDYGHALLDVGNQIWAMAPWSTDVLQALAALVSDGEKARAPLNLLWMLAAVLLVRDLAKTLHPDPVAAWIAALLYATLPFVAVASMGHHVEAASPAMFAALARVLLDGSRPDAARLRLVACLAGVLVGSKSSNGLLLLPFAVWMIWAWRTDLPWKALPLSTALGFLVGGSSYVYCGWLTGNPVLPLFNDIFQSPWAPPEPLFRQIWTTGFSWDLPWRLVFHTTDYSSVHPGGGGLVWLALLGGTIPAAMEKGLRVPLMVSLSAMAAMFWMDPHLRYVQPLTALLIPVLVVALLRAAGGWQKIALAAVAMAQLAFQSAGLWLLMAGGIRLFALEGAEAVHMKFSPERLLSARFRASSAPDHRLLFGDAGFPYNAELPGKSLALSWHTPDLLAFRAARKGNPEVWRSVVERTGATHFVTRMVASRPRMADFLLLNGARRVATAGKVDLYELAPPAPLAATVHSASGGVIRAQHQFRGTQPEVGRFSAAASCDRPAAMVGISWVYSNGKDPPTSRNYWLPCGADGRVQPVLALAVPAVPANLHLRMHPVDPASGMTLALQASQLELRRDAMPERQLYPRVWAAVCPGDWRWCRADGLQLTPLQ